jgi:hypothetical protein
MIRRKLVTVVCYTALGFSFAISVYVTERFFALAVKLDNMSVALANLEKTVQKRELADPLTPSECSAEPGLGESKQRPCHITFSRLLQAPQKFHERWIVVDGLYAARFEESALYSPSYNASQAVIMQRHSGIWVSPLLQSNKTAPTEKTLIGRFENGASGHMSAYFGKLTNAADVSGTNKN